MQIAYIDIKTSSIKSLFSKVDVINKNEGSIFYIPTNKKQKICKYKINKLSRIIVKELEERGINTVILEEKLKKYERVRNNLYSQNINILDGRYLFKCLMVQILNYITHLKKQQIRNIEVSVLVNEYNSLNKEIIADIANNVKIINIITSNINKFKKLEKYFYDEYGIILNISNNKKTSLLKTPIIINLDFPEELINKYKIYDKAIIINASEKIEIESKKFNGINASYYKIDIPSKYRINGFKDEEIYEGKLYNCSYKTIQKEVKKNKIKIEYLIGSKGIILEEEFK